MIEHFVYFWRALTVPALAPHTPSQFFSGLFSLCFMRFPVLSPPLSKLRTPALLIYIKLFIKPLYEKLFTLSTRFSTITFPMLPTISAKISASAKSKPWFSTHLSPYFNLHKFFILKNSPLIFSFAPGQFNFLLKSGILSRKKFLSKILMQEIRQASVPSSAYIS